MVSKNLQKSSAIQNNSVILSSVIIAIIVCKPLYLNTIKLQQFSLITKITDAYNSSNSRYIITLERDRETDPMDETTVRRDISKCPRTVFLYDYTGRLLKIVDVGMPIMRIAANRNSNVLYMIGGNPDYVLAKCEL